MTAQTVRAVLLRMQTDNRFLEAMKSDPEGCLSDYDLTEDERSALIHRSDDLRGFLLPDDAEVKFVITIKGTHDWFNVVASDRDVAAAQELVERSREVAARVLEADGVERVDQLMTLLQLLDRRAD